MKLLPAVVVIILIYLAGFLFLRMRQPSRNGGLLKNSQTARTAVVVLLLLLLGLLFKILGKVAILIGAILFGLFFLTFRKR